ncbi:MAG: cohesin domain-containing protein, partial [Acutalibacteraceae bacterium]
VAEPTTEPTTVAEPTTEPTTVAEPTTEPTTAEPPVSQDAVINGVTAHVGDTISYTVTLQAAEKLVNFQATTNYDSSILELVKPLDTEVAFPVDPDVVYNEDLDGMVKFNDSKLKGIDFTTEGVLVTLNFKVIAGGTTDVWTVIEEMNSVNDTVYAADGVMVSEYSFNESVAVVDCPHTTEPTTEPTTEEPVTDPVTEPATDAPATDAPATPDEPTTVAPTTTPNTPGTEGPSNGAVQTGDAATAVVLLSILVAAAGVMFLVRRRVQG